MRKIFPFVCIAVLALSLAACSKKDEQAAPEQTEPPALESQEESPAPEPLEESEEAEVSAEPAAVTVGEEPPAEEIPAGSPRRISGWIDGDEINMRAEPSTSAEILTVLNNRQEISVLGSEGEWAQVIVNGKEGYVHLTFVKLAQDAPAAPAADASNAAPEQSAGGAHITDDSVNLRGDPTTAADIVAVLQKGQRVNVLGEVNDWVKVDVNGKEGYVNSRFISIGAEAAGEPEEQPAPEIQKPANAGVFTIAIDPGHQQKGNSELEPIGPGASESKAKVAGGTRGVATNVPEYMLTLDVSQKLRDELLSRGYNVCMIREIHDVNISNRERAAMATDAGADILVRIHADGSENQSVNGILTLCPTARNPYVPHLYAQSRALSEDVLNAMVAATGARNRGVSEVDNMSGINWSTVPVTIVEMGLMTNPEEDRLMQTLEYQQKLVKGIADGIETYLAR